MATQAIIPDRAAGAPADESDADSGAVQPLDLCDARPGGPAERLAAHLPLHPALAALVVGVGGFLVLAALVIGWGFLLRDVLLPGDLQRWDVGNVRFLVTGRPEWDGWASAGTFIADAGPVIALGTLVVAFAFLRRWWAAGGVLLVALPIEGLLYLTGSRVVARTRPPVERFEQLPADTSYPSGHTAAALVLYTAIAVIVWNSTKNRWARAVACIPAILAPPIVGVSRMYRGMHFATDVITGYAIGIGCIVVGLTAVRVAGAVAERRAGGHAR